MTEPSEPPPPEARVHLPMRVRPATRDKVAWIAAAENRTRSDMARILLGEGIAAWERRNPRHG